MTTLFFVFFFKYLSQIDMLGSKTDYYALEAELEVSIKL